MTWNFNMAEAPKHRPIIAAMDEPFKTTTKSEWIPAEGRWKNFPADKPPRAWQHWPDHPDVDGMGDLM